MRGEEKQTNKQKRGRRTQHKKATHININRQTTHSGEFKQKANKQQASKQTMGEGENNKTKRGRQKATRKQ